MFSPMYLPAMNSVLSVYISLSSVPFILCVMTPEAILYTQLSREIGQQFLTKCRGLFFLYASYYSFSLSDR